VKGDKSGPYDLTCPNGAAVFEGRCTQDCPSGYFKQTVQSKIHDS
jgi:hypothetical protein